MHTVETRLKKAITNHADFPKTGIQFKDLNPLYKDAVLFQQLVDLTVKKIKTLGEFDYVAGVEARGFILGAAVAQKLGLGFIPVRKKGKLPGPIASITYALEYGTDSLEIQQDTSIKGSRVLVLDDVFATGGTLKAVVSLFQPLVKSVSCVVLFDIQIAAISDLGVPSAIILP